MEENRKALAEKLKELRHSLGVTQENMSKNLHISRSCLANYESGKRRPDPELLTDIAKFLHVDTSILFECVTT